MIFFIGTLFAITYHNDNYNFRFSMNLNYLYNGMKITLEIVDERSLY
jgi:hypothetical protein